eukprot:CAMPEP_0119153430 /NCGR_PEP_ID=MMETSP1310-20130426/49258_1 /TAXON_ID=464262 /ORGANISM="Genus nov. species nov., Strain RCC2339" /LENGTH=109 /DNA_ID=CAMNT_0007145881 /DNA_START=95 /DNA_END=424 /DNA_ORIENTATION=+
MTCGLSGCPPSDEMPNSEVNFNLVPCVSPYGEKLGQECTSLVVEVGVPTHNEDLNVVQAFLTRVIDTERDKSVTRRLQKLRKEFHAFWNSRHTRTMPLYDAEYFFQSTE